MHLLRIGILVLSIGSQAWAQDENCAVVRAILDAGWGDTHDELVAPAIEQECALKNGFHDGVVLVDAVLKGNATDSGRWQPFLRPGQTCGQDVEAMPPSSIPRSPERLIKIVGMELTGKADGEYGFDLFLKPVWSTDPYQKKGVTGTTCLPSASGTVRKAGDKWAARVTEGYGHYELRPELRAKHLKSLQRLGFAPKRWPPRPEDRSVRLISGIQERRGRSEILLSIVNLTGTSMFVPRRMVLNAPGAAAPVRDVWYEVLDKKQEALPFKCAMTTAPLTGKEFEKLEDGKGFSALLPLDLCYGLLNDQWYEVKVHLKYTPQDTGGLPGGALTDEVVAASIKFQYRGPDPIDVHMEKLSTPKEKKAQ
jgi:hypothetical protein